MPADLELREIVVDACRLAAWANAAGRETLAARALDDAQAFLELAAHDLGPAGGSEGEAAA